MTLTIGQAREVLDPKNFDAYNDEVQDEALKMAVASLGAWEKILSRFEKDVETYKKYDWKIQQVIVEQNIDAIRNAFKGVRA